MLTATALRCARNHTTSISTLPTLTQLLRLPLAPHSLSTSQRRYASMDGDRKHNIALIGSGTIGLSFAALHLVKNPTCTVTIYDSRPDLYDYVSHHLPNYIGADEAAAGKWRDRLTLAPTLQKAVEYADVVQEQGPEKEAWKKELWPEVEKHARSDALLWSSTSGIPASVQCTGMRDKTRLLVVHPYNPPHVMPMLEVVPGSSTSQAVINKTVRYWRSLGRTPVVIKKECTGFVANRLAFALFREACSLVAQGVVSVKDLDAIVTTSMGPRWSVAGPFKAYHAGGGEGGLTSFMDKIGDTVQECWDASAKDVETHKINIGESGTLWQERVCREAEDAYGQVDTAERDVKTRKVLEAVKDK